MTNPAPVLDPTVLARVQALEFHARSIVEGYLTGGHRSPHRGFAVEFAQHREYVPGDDVKHIDWKVFARSERYYLKQYEQDTNLVAWLAVDQSESMAYGSGALTKADLANRAAAALAFLITRQSDSVGLIIYDAEVRGLLPPAGTTAHLHDLCRSLTMPAGPARTAIGPVLHDLAQRIRRRGVIVLFSDWFDEPEDILSGLKHLRHARHEVVVVQVLDAAELDFPFEEATLFRGLEGLPALLTDPRGVRRDYLRELAAHRSALQSACRSLNIDYLLLRTDADLGGVLAEWLSRRVP
jgi:uncharacterized protein (DUF58 family)